MKKLSKSDHFWQSYGCLKLERRYDVITWTFFCLRWRRRQKILNFGLWFIIVVKKLHTKNELHISWNSEKPSLGRVKEINVSNLWNISENILSHCPNKGAPGYIHCGQNGVQIVNKKKFIAVHPVKKKGDKRTEGRSITQIDLSECFSSSEVLKILHLQENPKYSLPFYFAPPQF